MQIKVEAQTLEPSHLVPAKSMEEDSDAADITEIIVIDAGPRHSLLSEAGAVGRNPLKLTSASFRGL